ncbi:unnamed protein product, partial [Effrenium voratum]
EAFVAGRPGILRLAESCLQPQSRGHVKRVLLAFSREVQERTLDRVCLGMDGERCIFALTARGGAAQMTGRKRRCLFCCPEDLWPLCEEDVGRQWRADCSAVAPASAAATVRRRSLIGPGLGAVARGKAVENTTGLLFHSCMCAGCGMMALSVADVPEALRGLSLEAAQALSPLEIDVGPVVRAEHKSSYRQHATMIRFRWHAAKVSKRIKQLQDRDMRRKTQAAHRFLMESGATRYATFVAEHEELLE